MIAKGKIRGEGGKLARYLMNGEPGERAELVETRGLERFGDPVTAFDRLEAWAGENSQCRKAFFHGHIRVAPNERLSDGQWTETVDRMEQRLGFGGQPRIVSFHINEATGEKHLHAAWFRVDLETQRAIDPGLYKNKLNQLSRESERAYALRELTSSRRPDHRAKAAGRDEFEEARRLGTDINATRTAILDCFEKSDSGRAFAAAIRAKGFELANGDRRDVFVLVDEHGGQHALTKKLTGMTLAEIRQRFADLDRSTLMSVATAKEMQAERVAREAAHGMKHGRGADRAGQGMAPSDALQPEIKPLGKTAGEIRLAWQLTRTAEQFVQEIERRGLKLVYVSRDEAEATQRAQAFAKAINRQHRAVREGFGVVDSRGNVTRIDQRVTGDQWEEIQKRLGGIEPRDLVGVADARDIMRERNRAAWAEQQQAARDKARPTSFIEQKIIDCGEQARRVGADILRGRDGTPVSAVEALADRFKPEDEREVERERVYGMRAVSALLDQAGIAVVRVTDADVQALDVLLSDEELARQMAKNVQHRQAQHFDRLEAGDLAAVTRSGEVYRLNPYRLDPERLEAQLFNGSVTDARAVFAAEREQIGELWTQHRAEITERAAERADTQAQREAVTAIIRDIDTVLDGGGATIDATERAGGRILGGVAKIIASAFEFLADLFSPPPLTPAQAQLAEQAAEEKAQERADAAAYRQRATAADWQAFEEQRSQQQAEQGISERLGTPDVSSSLDKLLRQIAKDDAERGEERDWGRERER